TPTTPAPGKPATGSPKPGVRDPDHFGPGDAFTGPGGTRLEKFLGKSVEQGPALALAAEGIIDYFQAKTKEQKFDAIMKLVTSGDMSPAVQRSLDPMLSAAAAALGEGLLSFASRFSSGLLLAPKDLTNRSRDPDEVYTH